MKFKVREGFVLKRTDMVQRGDKFEPRDTIAYEGEEIDLTELQAAEHLHQLEAVDKAAQKFADARTVATAPVAAGGLDGEALQALIGQTVQAAVAAALAAVAAAPAAAPNIAPAA